MAARVVRGRAETFRIAHASDPRRRGALFHHYDTTAEIATVVCDAATPPDAGAVDGAPDRVRYAPAFAQYGFRYARVNFTGAGVPTGGVAAGDVELEATFVSTLAAAPGARFACGNAVLNATRLGSRARVELGVDPDRLPDAERAGWLGGSASRPRRCCARRRASGLHGAYRLFCELMARSRADDDNLPDVVPFLGGHGGAGTPTWTRPSRSSPTGCGSTSTTRPPSPTSTIPSRRTSRT